MQNNKISNAIDFDDGDGAALERKVLYRKSIYSKVNDFALFAVRYAPSEATLYLDQCSSLERSAAFSSSRSSPSTSDEVAIRVAINISRKTHKPPHVCNGKNSVFL